MQLRNFHDRLASRIGDRGATSVEYSILIGLIAVVSIFSTLTLGTKVSAVYTNVADTLQTEIGTAPLVAAANEDCSPYATYDYYGSPIQTKLHTNVWNAQGNESLCVTYGSGAAGVAEPWGWKWTVPGNGIDVIAYPGVVFGQQPFMGYDPAPAATQLGALVADLSYAYQVKGAQGIYNVAASSWVLDSAVSRPEHIIGEVMVWVENNGMTPAGSLIASNITIDGAAYDIYQQAGMVDASGSIPNSWNYFAFLRTSGPARSGTLSMQSFTQYLVSQGEFQASHYVASVEFGSEVLQGTGEILASHLTLSGMSGSGASDSAPAVAAFDFGTTSIAANTVDTTVTSPYRDLGLGSEPRVFNVSADDPLLSPVAISNVLGGGSADAGQILYGTALQAAMPAQGQTSVITLDVEGTSGTWTITRNTPLVFASASDLGVVTAPVSGGATLATIHLSDPNTAGITLITDNGGLQYGEPIGGIGDFQLQPNGSDPLAIDLVCYWGPNCRGTHNFVIDALSNESGETARESFQIDVQ